MNPKYQPFFDTFRFRSGVEVKNRLVMAPMTTYSGNPDDTVSKGELTYYARRSRGVGMVITACTYVTANGKGFPGEFAGDRDEMIPSLRSLATAIKEQGAKAVLQIFHAGRMSPPELVPHGKTVSASAVAAEQQGAPVPSELTDAEIQDIIKAFGETTRRAIEAGYDGVEIHGANGYLVQQFFSPHSNRRNDHWGGSLEKRMRFPLAIVDEVKRVVAAHAKQPFLIGYRFSPEEAETPGITMADTLVLTDALAQKELDYLHVSLMNFWSTPRSAEGTRSETRLELIQKQVASRVPVMGVGSIRTADEALQAFETGVPLLALGRELIIEPEWVEKVQNGQEADIQVEIDKNDQARLEIPDPLWHAILHTPGWFPISQKV
ncbi:NADH-dependent flavin oxidoreductase [Brevibacillus nitrificans]|uniref:NADH-dependent flavin oxidoreductase n=1 Tax=Brevibacillus nitrificans TaxID=651560 RepID=UPI0026024DA1|nr:NADH-dependent flavin oxidoreductase [Brevibacillus nitrificans]MED1795987.1 NADH-dependent flavin oxidoreductase [Brevibacillus nitrificans]